MTALLVLAADEEEEEEEEEELHRWKQPSRLEERYRLRHVHASRRASEVAKGQPLAPFERPHLKAFPFDALLAPSSLQDRLW